jgi:Type IV secretion system pilin
MQRFLSIQKISISLIVLNVLACGTLALTPVRVAAAPVSATFAADTKDNCPTLGHLHETNAATGHGEDCFIKTYVNPFIKFFAGIVGVFAVISIIIGGIEYAASADDPSKVKSAKQRIVNAVLGILAFLFLYAFLQWVVPGGVKG